MESTTPFNTNPSAEDRSDRRNALSAILIVPSDETCIVLRAEHPANAAIPMFVSMAVSVSPALLVM